MMKASALAVLGIGMILVGTSACTQAETSGPGEPGMMCRQPDDSLWWGRFSGGREVSVSFDSDSVERYTSERCFSTEAECRTWLYALKSAYGFAPEWNECRRGYRPGTPMKPWYSGGQ